MSDIFNWGVSDFNHGRFGLAKVPGENKMPAHPSFLKAMPHREIDLPWGNNLSLPLPSLGFKVKILQIPGLQSFVTAKHNLTAPSKSSSTDEWCARLLRLEVSQVQCPDIKGYLYLAKRGEREIYFDSPPQLSLKQAQPLIQDTSIELCCQKQINCSFQEKTLSLFHTDFIPTWIKFLMLHQLIWIFWIGFA